MMDSDLIVVFSGNLVDSEIIKEILDDNGITTNLKNELMGTIAPWQVSAGGFEPVEIEVLVEDRKKALELINAFHKSN